MGGTMHDTAIAVEIRDLAKSFKTESGESVAALDGLSLAVPEGGFVTIIGPTGCGKSTTLNVIAGLEPFDSGSLKYGWDSDARRSIACVFQHYTLFPWRSVLRNVTFGMQMKGIPKKERRERARDLLSKVGLSGFENAYPHELSGGMRQRAAIAQALATDPRLLLMDEPFGALDDPTRRELHKMILKLWSESGTTILFVTHSLDEAVALADKVLVLSERPGRVISEYDIRLPRPRDPHSREFIDQYVDVRESLPSAFS